MSATETILQIPTVRTYPLTDDSMEVQSIATGSGQLALSLLVGGTLLASGTATLNTTSATLQTINFGSTLPSIPSRVEVQFYKTAAAALIPSGAVVLNESTTTQFQLQLAGPLDSTTAYTIFWKAFA